MTGAVQSAELLQTLAGAQETIKYQMPTFTLNGRNLVHFAAYKNYVGLYPAPRGVEQFKSELSAYEGAKSSVSFPFDRPIPLGLIGRIVKFRAKSLLGRERRKSAD